MAIRGSKSIAEYCIRRWLEREHFVDGFFALEMNGNEGIIKDRVGNSLVLVYDPDLNDVRIKE